MATAQQVRQQVTQARSQLQQQRQQIQQARLPPLSQAQLRGQTRTQSIFRQQQETRLQQAKAKELRNLRPLEQQIERAEASLGSGLQARKDFEQAKRAALRNKPFLLENQRQRKFFNQIKRLGKFKFEEVVSEVGKARPVDPVIIDATLKKSDVAVEAFKTIFGLGKQVITDITPVAVRQSLGSLADRLRAKGDVAVEKIETFRPKIEEFIDPSQKDFRQAQERSLANLERQFNRLEGDVQNFNTKFGDRELSQKDFNLAEQRQTNLNTRILQLEAQREREGEAFSRVAEARNFGDPFRFFSEIEKKVATAPLDIAQLGIRGTTRPTETAKLSIEGIKNLPSEIAKAPFSSIGALVGTAVGTAIFSEALLGGITRLGKAPSTPKIPLLSERLALSKRLPKLKFKDVKFKGRDISGIKINKVSEIRGVRILVRESIDKKFPLTEAQKKIVIEMVGKEKAEFIIGNPGALEPQVADAVLLLNRKGFDTVTSGFSPNHRTQHIVFKGKATKSMRKIAKELDIKIISTRRGFVNLFVNQKGKSLLDVEKIFKSFAKQVKGKTILDVDIKNLVQGFKIFELRGKKGNIQLLRQFSKIEKAKAERARRALAEFQKRIAGKKTLQGQLKELAEIRKKLKTEEELKNFDNFVTNQLIDTEILKIPKIKGVGFVVGVPKAKLSPFAARIVEEATRQRIKNQNRIDFARTSLGERFRIAQAKQPTALKRLALNEQALVQVNQLRSKQRLNQQEIQKTRQKLSQLTFQKASQQEISKQQSKLRQLQLQSSALRTQQTQIQKQIQRQRQRQRGRGRTKTRTRFGVPIPFSNSGGGAFAVKKKVPVVRKKGFNVLVKTRGVFRKQNVNPLTRRLGNSLGSLLVDKSTSRTFKLVRSGKGAKKPKLKIPRSYWQQNKSKFRGKKIGGKAQPISLLKEKIEKRRHLIDSRGEKRGLSVARARAKLLPKKQTRSPKNPFRLDRSNFSKNLKKKKL